MNKLTKLQIAIGMLEALKFRLDFEGCEKIAGMSDSKAADKYADRVESVVLEKCQKINEIIGELERWKESINKRN